MSTQPVSPEQTQFPVTDWLQDELGEASSETQAAVRHEDCRRFGELPSDPIELGIALLFEPGQTVEMRIPKAGKHGTVSGYFTDFRKLADEIRAWSGKVEGVYYTLNPVASSLLARSANRAKTYAKLTTSDPQIVRRFWLPIDIDPARPSGISSTDAEKSLARVKATAVYEYLRALGWPEPLKCDSGNGYHLLYLIDLPNDDAASALLEKCLKALAVHFDDATVKIDQKVFNAARIIKAYGSLAAKGDNIPDRPHRVARCYRPAVEDLKAVSPALLEALAAQVPTEAHATPQSSGRQISPERVEQFLDSHGIEHQARKDDADGYKWILSECLFNAEHKAPDAAVLLRANGVLGFECFHNSCTSKHWKEFRAEAEKRSGKQFWFFDRPEQEREKPRNRPATELHEPSRVEAITPAVTPAEPKPALETPYPVNVWDGTLYGEFAEICSRENYIPREFLIESLKTVVGSIVSNRLRFARINTSPRFYTILIMAQGGGKGTAISLATEMFEKLPTPLLGPNKPAYQYLGALQCSPASEPGLLEAMLKHPDVIAVFGEVNIFFDKGNVPHGGSSLLGLVRDLYDSESPRGTQTKERKEVPAVGRFSLLGGTTPEIWDTMFVGSNSQGSGIFGRLNLIASGETRTVATIETPNLLDLQARLFQKIISLDEQPAIVTISPEARAMLQSWFDSIPPEVDADVRNRLNVLAQKNALHLSWLLTPAPVGDLGHPLVTPEIMAKAIRLSDYQLAVRKRLAPIVGDNPHAVIGNKLVRLLYTVEEIPESQAKKAIHYYRYGTRVYEQARDAEIREGHIRRYQQKTLAGQGRWMLGRVVQA